MKRAIVLLLVVLIGFSTVFAQGDKESKGPIILKLGHGIRTPTLRILLRYSLLRK